MAERSLGAVVNVAPAVSLGDPEDLVALLQSNAHNSTH
jgi:hypothetical protein